LWKYSSAQSDARYIHNGDEADNFNTHSAFVVMPGVAERSSLFAYINLLRI